MEGSGSRRRRKQDDPQNAVQVCHRNHGLVSKEQAVSGDGKPVKEAPLSAMELCKPECSVKKKEKRRKTCVFAIKDSISSSLPSLSTADDAGVEECERSGRVKSSLLIVKEKKRSLAASNEGVDIVKDGNRKKKPKKRGQSRNTSHHDQGDFIKLSQENVPVANDMFVKMPSTVTGSHRKKNKRKKGHGREAIDSPSKDNSVSRKPQLDAVFCCKKINRKDEDAQIQDKDFPNKGPIDSGFLEDVRPDITALPNSNATTLMMVCPTRSTNGTCIAQQYSHRGIIEGKRFSKEEDEIVRDAVCRYIEEYNLGKDGIRMLLNRRKYPQVRVRCWDEIAASIPWRLPIAVKHRAEKLFLNDIGHKWTPEEIEFVTTYVKQHGRHWAPIADHLGISCIQAYRAWTRYKNPNYQLGTWKQDECQHVFDLVHNDLRQTAVLGKNYKCGIARENISWTAISDEMGTRNMFSICKKWYRSLSSSMVAQGLWSDVDDYHLVYNLLKLDACCVEDVDWDNILSNRSGAICRKRWFEMTKHIGGKVERPFMEQLELLSTRYRIDMLEYRERALARTS